jgi:hypothetical protein
MQLASRRGPFPNPDVVDAMTLDGRPLNGKLPVELPCDRCAATTTQQVY